MPHVNIQGKRLAYEVQPKDFDPASLSAVLIHGSGGDREDWRNQLDGLADAASIVALELPGHGESDPPGERSIEAYASWTAAFVEALGLTRVVLAGCSLGSAIAQWIALSRAAWLKGIVLVGSGARLKVMPAFLDGLKQAPENALSMLADFALSPAAKGNVREALAAKFRHASAEIIHGDLSACNAFDVMERISEFSLPTSIIVGEDDRLTPVKYSQFLNARIAGSRLAIIPAAGHMVMLEQPAQFNAELRKFLWELKNQATG